MTDDVLAHSPPKRGGPGEGLRPHLAVVAAAAARRARALGLEGAAAAAGWLHDIGKASAAFQGYIRGRGASPDHSGAGAREALALYDPRAAAALAYVVAGHHAGLPDGDALRERLARPVPDYAGWRAHADPPPREAVAAGFPAPGAGRPGAPAGFAEAFRIRMLFSCLVDADFTETARFYADAPGEAETAFASIPELHDRLAGHMARVQAAAPDTRVNRLRTQVLEHAVGKAALAPGLFTLTVPTGGGKTLTSLAFALEHARRHGLRRVVYVIPFTSIIEQTADIFRTALGEDQVLEHTSTFDWEEAQAKAERLDPEGLQGDDGLARLRRTAPAWEAPVVVTTAVQFFESLFANRTSRCRKLHNLAGAVIVLDEAQTLPLPLLRPCLAALDELAHAYRATVVLCTATQPAIREQDGFKGGLYIPAERELAPDPQALFGDLRRVTITRREGVTPDAEIAARFAEAPQMLAIVNSRAHAQALFAAIGGEPGARHLSTLMCPRHRRKVLAEVRADLAAGAPVRLVATSLIEAGVDVSFPEVWRAETGLEGILHGGADRNTKSSFRPTSAMAVAPSRGRGSKQSISQPAGALPAVAPSRGRGSKPGRGGHRVPQRVVAPSRGRGSKRRLAAPARAERGVAPSRGRGSKPGGPLPGPGARPSPPHGGADRNVSEASGTYYVESRPLTGARIET